MLPSTAASTAIAAFTRRALALLLALLIAVALRPTAVWAAPGLCIGPVCGDDGRAEPNLMPYRLSLSSGNAKHVQYPTTLPTFDELIGIDGANEFGAVDKILEITNSNPNDQVFTLHAELEGQKLLPAFEKLLMGWLNQGHDLVTMGQLHQSWKATNQLDKIAVLPLTWGEIPNRSGELIVQ